MKVRAAAARFWWQHPKAHRWRLSEMYCYHRCKVEAAAGWGGQGLLFRFERKGDHNPQSYRLKNNGALAAVLEDA